MWLLNVHSRDLESFQDSDTPSYAILSHTWDKDEVSFKDVQKRHCSDREGYRKVDLCCKHASSSGYDYVWIDTCCIDKRSSAELSEAINSMYRWYSEADICYAYFSDVSTADDEWVQSKWFTRGWTLQELLAPRKLEFYDNSWRYLGNKLEDWQAISDRTSIPLKALVKFNPIDFSIAQRMSWAVDRVTTRSEDRAYSLLGIFDVNMPLLYGEGGMKAFYRLQEEIMKISTDLSIFAWSCSPHPSFGMLARSPDSFPFPMIAMHKHEQPEEKQLIPLTSDYIHTKTGISGTFTLRLHSFNIYVAEIGKLVGNCPVSAEIVLQSTYVGIFLQYFPSDKQYRRVEFDGAFCIELGLSDYLRSPSDSRMIQISRCTLTAVESNALSTSACAQLTLRLTFGPMLSAGYLRLGNSEQPLGTKILFVRDQVYSSVISCPCIVFKHNLYIHFGYDLRQQLAIFISSFEGDFVDFITGRKELFASSLQSNIERLKSLDYSNGSEIVSSDAVIQNRQWHERLFTQVPSLEELLQARNVNFGSSCLFTFLPQIGGHRVLLSFKQKHLNIWKAPIPQSWYTPEPLAQELWKRLDVAEDIA